MPLAGLDLSSGARAGLTAFLAGVARSVAASMSPSISCCPAPFDTDRLRDEHRGRTPKNKGISREAGDSRPWRRVPAKRFGTPDEFGAACAFLCSAQAGYITGQNLLIDGGVFPGAF